MSYKIKRIPVDLSDLEIRWVINLLKDRLDKVEKDGNLSEEDENDIEEGRNFIERLKGHLG